MKLNSRICVLGAGKIGEAIIKGLINSGAVPKHNISATVSHKDTARRQAKLLGIKVDTDNKKAVRNANIIIIAVKPKMVEGLLDQIKDVIHKGQLVISVAAAITTSLIEEALGDKIAVIRTMPNIACGLNCGMTALSPGRHCAKKDIDKAVALFSQLGRAIVIDEQHLDAVTGVSASGPAFVYIMIEALADGGVKVGLPREIATELVAQTMFGAAKMVVATKEHPAKLKDMVTTPAGCTIDGIMEMEDGGVRHSLIKAVVMATERARELAANK